MGFVKTIGSFDTLALVSLLGQSVLAMLDKRDAVNRQVSATAHGDKDGQFLAPGCCMLFHYPDNQCPYEDRPSNYTCQPGYSRRWSLCMEGTATRVCAECTAGPTSWHGPSDCSIWWWA